METKKGTIKKLIPLEECKSSFNYLVELEDGTSVEASSQKEYTDGDKVRIIKNSVPSYWQIFEGNE